MMTTGDWLDAAMAARLQGNDAQAINLCQQRLNEAPDDPDALSLLGVSFAETGNVADARPLIEKALAQSPGHWRYLLDRSVLEEAEGQMEAAATSAQKSTVTGANRFETWGRLGDLLGRIGDFAGAADALGKALNINPQMPVLALRLAGARFEIADYSGANAALDLFEPHAPGHPHAIKLRTHIARQTRDWEGLLQSAKRWLEVASAEEESPARVALAYAYAQGGVFARAAETFEPVASRLPLNADHLSTYAQYLLGARDMAAARAVYEKALSVDPAHAEALSGLARICVYEGDMDVAREFARKAIKADPGNIEAFAQLAFATGGRLDQQEIDQLAKLSDSPALPLEQRARGWFSVGDAYHRLKDAANAFAAWERGNKLKLQIAAQEGDARYDRDVSDALVERTVRYFATAKEPTAQQLKRRPAPIFIVGMPRSGTTLLESAIAAHSQVAAGGELPLLPYAKSQLFDWADEAGWTGGALPDHVIDDVRARYFTQYADYGIADAPFVTDKQPSNALSVGIIKQVFPEAKIIHIRRNPLETGFSIFRRDFARAWQFANSLGDIAHYYATYSRAMNSWDTLYPGDIGFVQYEDMVRDFEGNIRRLIEFCGLDWETACLEYYKQDRTVITFSTAQVRKPPSPEHLNSTAPYVEFLRPLADALESYRIDPETGAAATSLTS